MVLAAIPAIAAADANALLPANGMFAAAPAAQTSFTQLLVDGLQKADAKVVVADNLIGRFALGEALPVHQVMGAIEEARIAVEMSTQVRSRLLETYRDLMNMQL